MSKMVLKLPGNIRLFMANMDNFGTFNFRKTTHKNTKY